MAVEELAGLDWTGATESPYAAIVVQDEASLAAEMTGPPYRVPLILIKSERIKAQLLRRGF